MRRLAPVLRVNYPGGHQWLAARLDDVQDGRARANLAFTGRSLIGVAIETPKAHGAVKLSTLWVAPAARSHGVGSALIDSCVSYWLTAGTPRSWVTVGAAARMPLTRVLCARGFTQTAVEPHRYGPGRHEWVLHWTPEQHLADRARPPALRDPQPTALRTSRGSGSATGPRLLAAGAPRR
jgi:GNAT superfamily N-acetyltransferase